MTVLYSLLTPEQARGYAGSFVQVYRSAFAAAPCNKGEAEVAAFAVPGLPRRYQVMGTTLPPERAPIG